MTLFNLVVQNLINIIYPKCCTACGNVLMYQEQELCTNCLYHIPKTRFHDDPANPVAQMFWGRVKLEYATSLFYYSKGSHYQKVMHQLKYKGKKEIGYELGKILGNELKKTKFNTIEAIIAVPLHISKLKSRGYNQSEFIAKGIAETMYKPYIKNIIERIHANESQTRKNKYQRWKNVENIFAVQDTTSLQGKHILLVDDIITTGATLEACTHELLKIKNTKISVATLGMASS